MGGSERDQENRSRAEVDSDADSGAESEDIASGSNAASRDLEAALRDRRAENRDARARERDEAASDQQHGAEQREQYLSDLDQRGSEHDQQAADEDQRAADRVPTGGGTAGLKNQNTSTRLESRHDREIVSSLREKVTAERNAAVDADRGEPDDHEFAERDRAFAAEDRRDAAEDRVVSAGERAASLRDRVESDSAARRALEALESMSDAFFTLDHEWRFTYMNPQSTAILDRRRESLIGSSIWETFPDAVGTPLESAMLQAARDRRPIRIEETYEGLGVTLDMRIHPVTEGVAVYYSDVTEERERDKHHRQAERMELLGQLTAGVVHDFNNYLLAIRSFAELGQAAANDDLISGYFEKVAFASSQGTALSRQLLAFGTEQEFDASEADLNDIVTDLWSLLQGMLPHGIKLVLKPSTEPVPVFVDRTRIEQVILNLVVNARDAIDENGSITVITANAAPKGATNEISAALGWLQVRDSGSGIPEDVKPHIFDPFFTTKATAKGTGLGLATTFEVITQSGGSITVDSTVDLGTTMTVALPRLKPSAANPSPSRQLAARA